jgi:hypothetical protein
MKTKSTPPIYAWKYFTSKSCKPKQKGHVIEAKGTTLPNSPSHARCAYLSCSFVVFPNSNIVGFFIVPIPWYHNLR